LHISWAVAGKYSRFAIAGERLLISSQWPSFFTLFTSFPISFYPVSPISPIQLSRVNSWLSVQRLFGHNGYVCVRQIQELSEKLTAMYARLAS